MLKSEAAAYLAGVTQTEGAEASAPTNLHVITGEVGEASADGKTLVKIDGLMFSESDDQFIEVDALGGLEEGDIATIVLTGEQGHAMTPLALGSIGSVDRITVRIAAIEADYIKVEQLDAAEARIGELEADHVSVDDLNAATARIGTLETTRATITDLEAATARIHSLEVDHVTIDNFEAATARIDDLEADHVSTDDLSAATARIGTLETNTADIGTIRANSAKVQNLTAAQLEADHATVGSLSTNYAHITNGVIDNAKIGYADVNNLSAHYAEIQNGKINSALIDTAAIVDEQVFTVTGNKATISEINADNITVRNLHTSNLTVDTADGYVTIGNKQTPTKEFLDSLKDELQQEIDGAVETFTSSAVPLLNNYPASDWVISGATEEEQRKAYAKHIGDICYVQNSALDQNGYAYRFAYDSTEQTFKWVLIKDSDVTKALGDISDLKIFESNTTTWMEETDEGLTTIHQNHTALSGVVDKTVVETKQLWYTKANTTAPSKPTAQVTSTSTAGNAWRVVVPAYNASYPNYYYCLQYKLADGTYAWSDVVRDIAMGESQQQGRKGVADAATAQSTADSATIAAATADGKAVAAQSTANANIKSSIQLWFTKANTTAPNKPTAQVTVNDATKTNQWNLAIPTYNSSYPNYFYCYQQQKGDGTWQWTDVVYDRSITEAQAKAQSALPSSEFNTFKTTTFKEVVDEVGENSTSISTLSETVSTKADQSTVTTLSNTVNTVKQTADTNKASITSLTQTVNNKADGSTVTTLTNRVSTVEQNLSGITTRVGKTESELDTVSNPNLTPWFGVEPYSTDAGYWKRIVDTEITSLGDGWAHISKSNTGSSAAFVNYFITSNGIPKDLKPSTNYTFLVEKRNVVCNTSVSGYTLVITADFQTAIDVFSSSVIGNFDEGAQYLQRTTAPDLSVATMFTRGYISVPAGSSIEMDIRISLYEGEYSGPYKPYVDQTLSSRVKSAETSIEQNTESIALRATKTEVFDAVQPNLSPFFSSHNTDGTYPNGSADGYWQPSNDKAYNRSCFMALEDGWAHLEACNSVQKEFVPQRVNSLNAGDKVTMLVEYRNATYTGSGANFYTRNYGNNVQLTNNWSFITTQTGSGEERHVFTVSSADGQQTWNGLADVTFTSKSSSTWTGDIRISFYIGEYTGPYKPYSGAQLYASQAELKVANDNINLKVSKNDVINQINVSTEGAKIQASRVEIDGTAVFNAAKSKLDAAYDAKGAASAVEQGLGGFDILWNRVSYDSDENAGGECYICAYDPITAIRSNANGWVMWNGAKRTIPRGGINPNNIVPYNIPVYLVCRLSSATSDTGTMYMVWYNSGWKYAVTPTPTAVGGTWTWTETTDMVIGKFVEPGLEVAFTECETYRQPLKWGSITTDTVTARSANAAAASAQSTANAAAPKANAVKRTQRIWYRTNASSAPATPGTASSNWVTKADDGNDAWTKMHIAISSTHKYIYTCEQYEMANGTVGYTSVLLDNTITVIDGGNIITGSVKANTLDAADINASKTLTVGAMTDAAASTILNSNVQVGGRNLLTANNAFITPTLYNAYDIYVTDPIESGQPYVLQLWDVDVSHSAKTAAQLGVNVFYCGESMSIGGWIGTNYFTSGHADHLTLYFTVYTSGSTVNSGGNTSGSANVLSHSSVTNTTKKYIRLYNSVPAVDGTRNMSVGSWKLEKGNKATDWTPAPEDMATAESLAGTNESLEGAIEDIGELSDQLVGTVTEQNKTITTIQTYLNSLRKDLDAEIQSRQQWLNFNSAEGLVIGAAGSTFKTVTTNTSQQFRSGGTVLAETSGTEFVAPVMRSDQLLIGNWMWTRRDNGNLSLKWIG